MKTYNCTIALAFALCAGSLLYPPLMVAGIVTACVAVLIRPGW